MSIDVGKEIHIEDFIKVSRFGENVHISEATLERVKKSREIIENIVKKKKPVYGVNTGFGVLASVRVSEDELSHLQKNILRSHSAGVGEPFEKEVIRGMMFLRAVSLSKGFSGIRPVLLEKIVEFLNKDVYPYVPKKGSVGASGDLSPLSHLFLPLIGEGYVIINGVPLKSAEGLKVLGVEPLSELKEKEGLALVNGTQAMNSVLLHVVWDAFNLLELAIISAGMSFIALNGIKDPFDMRIHELRPHPGQIHVADEFNKLLVFYKENEKVKTNKVQDAYSLRAIPQVYGAVYDVLSYVKTIAEREANSVTDNPLVFPNGDVLSGGNFHGEPLALSADFLSIALTDLGNMIERRIDRLMNPTVSEGLPPFLSGGKAGLNSGLMIFQYTTAALCNENKVLSHPASCDTIPTSAYKEDHVSMGMNSVLKLQRVFENLVTIVAIEFMSATLALGFRKVKLSGKMRECYEKIKDILGEIQGDEFFWEKFSEVHRWLLKKVKEGGKV